MEDNRFLLTFDGEEENCEEINFPDPEFRDVYVKNVDNKRGGSYYFVQEKNGTIQYLKPGSIRSKRFAMERTRNNDYFKACWETGVSVGKNYNTRYIYNISEQLRESKREWFEDQIHAEDLKVKLVGTGLWNALMDKLGTIYDDYGYASYQENTGQIFFSAKYGSHNNIHYPDRIQTKCTHCDEI